MMNRRTIVGIGEILWDVFPDGPRFGGAPANFACSAAGLAGDEADVFMVSSVGTDDLGKRAIDALQARNVNTSHVTTQNKATGQVAVELDDVGRASYQFAADTAWDNIGWSLELENLAARTDALCFGTLGQRSAPSRMTIRQFVGATPPSALRVLDANLRSPFYTDVTILDSLSLANVLKLNDEELPQIAELCKMAGTDNQLLQQLAQRFNYQLVALTRGPRGAVLLQGNRVSEHPGVSTKIVDTVGAGDAFTAALVIGLLRGDDLDEMNKTACAVAAYVCSQAGATPEMPPSETIQRLADRN